MDNAEITYLVISLSLPSPTSMDLSMGQLKYSLSNGKQAVLLVRWLHQCLDTYKGVKSLNKLL